MTKKINNGVFYVAISLVCVALVIGISANAGISLKQMIANVTGDILADKLAGELVDESDNLGAVPSPDVFNRMYFHAGFDSNSSIDISVNQVATTSAANPAVAGFFCNGGEPLLIGGEWYFDLETANDGWGSNWTIGTTTRTGDDSFTATSSATLIASTAITTSTTGFYDAYGAGSTVLGSWYDGGNNATTTPWVLERNECIVVTSDMSGATSSDESFTAGGGEAGYTPIIGTFHSNAVYR